MSARRYGPDDTWPSHQKPYWNAALAEARRASWTLIFINAPHRFGVVSCPGGEHTFEVDQTARGGETKAKEATKKIRWCSHGTGAAGSKVSARRQECTQLLDVAGRLIAAVEEGLSMAEAKQTAQADLDRLEAQLRTAASNVEGALRAAQEEALQAAIDADDAPKPETLSATLDDAAATVERGASVAKALRSARPALAGSLLDRATGMRTLIAELHGRLRTLLE